MFRVSSRLTNTLKVLPSVRCTSVSTSPGQLVKITIDNEGICSLTLQRPPVNSLNLELLEDINRSLDEIGKSGCTGMILTSAMPKAFCAGLDINEIYKPDLDRLKTFWSTLQKIWTKLFGSSFITAAAINGHAPAGGCNLVLSCEYRAMVPDKLIGLNEFVLGIPVPKWLMETMRYTISSRNTELAATCGKLFKTDEALEVGLIDDLATDKDDAIDKCKQFIKKFDSIPSSVRAQTKMLVREPVLQFLTNPDHRKEDLEASVAFVKNQETQFRIESYLNGLKNKRK